MRVVTTVDGTTHATPLFLPVFERDNGFVTTDDLQNLFGVRGLITNGFFIYKERALRTQVAQEGIQSFLGFDGLVMTDSGAFQQFTRQLYLSNKKIIAFQQEIGADIISPLDLISTPGENRTTATKKLDATLRRIEKGLEIATDAVLAGVQQGGRFLDLRARALEALKAMGCQYIALGSLVPFFNKRHDLEFAGEVIYQGRDILGEALPVHLYGAGDPVELPFYFALGCDIFDSSSFVHYAMGGWCMTPFGAFKLDEQLPPVEFLKQSPFFEGDFEALGADTARLARHNLWMILHVIEDARQRKEAGTLLDHLDHVAEVHQHWFPDSKLQPSWHILRQACALA
ncbi:MAG TPA: tRNA-guanine transglycosylase [Rhodothermales bacterium]|nr:tRNA-guanine transglycosylase [Rhodothermales bacterium]